MVKTDGDTNGRSNCLSFLREPLLHFLIFAALFLSAYQLVTGSGAAPGDVITVDGKQIAQLQQVLAKNLQRAPTDQELKGAIDDYVKEEIYYREAKRLGLDQDDTVIRRRLRQKMEFLTDLEAGDVKPSEQELVSYYTANRQKFAEEPSLAFQQLFVSGEAAGGKAQALLKQLQSAPAQDVSQLGDPTSLPPEMPLASLTEISAVFGNDFAAALNGLEAGKWSGPVASGFGLHIVRITGRKDGRVPEFASVRDAVAREWAYEKRQQREAERFAQYLKTYRVKIDASGMGAAP